MADLQITIGTTEFDHVRDLMTGVVKPIGVDVLPLVFPRQEELFHRFVKYLEFDVAEFSFGTYVGRLSRGADDMIALPVFPSRVFRQAAFFVRADSPVQTPADLSGKKVGVANWAQTAAIYARGYLVHDQGVALADVDWYQAGVNQAGRATSVDVDLPEGVSVTPVPDDTLDDMLLGGRLDGIISARAPDSFVQGNPEIRRVFEDPESEERSYYQRTGVYPIMHLFVMRRALYEQHRWLATNLVTAFEQAKQRSIARSLDGSVSRYPFPWGVAHAERMHEMFDGDPMPYGIESNRTTLEAFLQFAYEQGVCARLLTPEELFPEEVQSTYRV